MLPSSRIHATIELLEELFTGWQSEKRFPADKVIDRYFKNRRYIGSGDRAYVGELFYWILRNLSLCQWRVGTQTNARLLVFSALQLRKEYKLAELEQLCDGSKYAPHTITDSERTALLKPQEGTPPDHVRLNYPEWLEPQLRLSMKDEFEKGMLALSEQASTDLRANTLKTTREALVAELNAEGFPCDETPSSPVGVRLQKRMPIFTSPLFKAGHFEVQDEGSQMVAGLVGAKPGMKVIDFCAGAGGKTLAIAAQMHNKGRILAWDVSAKRLLQIKERLKRAGVDNVQTHVIESESDAFIKRHKATADRVLVDAPCSGTGTWRRNPDLKWRFSAQDLQEVAALQTTILQSASRLVAVGGRLIYATCSILPCENDEQVEKFIKNNANFRVVCAKKVWNNICAQEDTGEQENAPASYLSVTPHQDGVDGFFAAVLERIS